MEARLGGGVQVRDSQHRDECGRNVSPVLDFSPADWQQLLGRIKAGELL
jgi:hypothetical protein